MLSRSSPVLRRCQYEMPPSTPTTANGGVWCLRIAAATKSANPIGGEPPRPGRAKHTGSGSPGFEPGGQAML